MLVVTSVVIVLFILVEIVAGRAIGNMRLPLRKEGNRNAQKARAATLRSIDSVLLKSVHEVKVADKWQSLDLGYRDFFARVDGGFILSQYGVLSTETGDTCRIFLSNGHRAYWYETRMRSSIPENLVDASKCFGDEDFLLVLTNHGSSRWLEVVAAWSSQIATWGTALVLAGLDTSSGLFLAVMIQLLYEVLSGSLLAANFMYKFQSSGYWASVDPLHSFYLGGKTGQLMWLLAIGEAIQAVVGVCLTLTDYWSYALLVGCILFAVGLSIVLALALLGGFKTKYFKAILVASYFLELVAFSVGSFNNDGFEDGSGSSGMFRVVAVILWGVEGLDLLLMVALPLAAGDWEKSFLATTADGGNVGMLRSMLQCPDSLYQNNAAYWTSNVGSSLGKSLLDLPGGIARATGTYGTGSRLTKAEKNNRSGSQMYAKRGMYEFPSIVIAKKSSRLLGDMSSEGSYCFRSESSVGFAVTSICGKVVAVVDN